MKKQRFAAKLISAVMMISVLTACGDTAEAPVVSSTETAANTAEQTESQTQETGTSDDLFGEDYDPFDENYDPYGGNGAFTVTSAHDHSNEVTASEEGSGSVSSESAAAAKELSAESKKKDSSEKNTKEKDKGKDKDKDKDSSSSEDVKLEINNSNSWNDGKSDYVQLDFNVKNNSKKTLNGWTVTVYADKGTTADQSWNCTITEKDGVFTITPVSYNTDIESGQAGNFGIIFKDPGKLDISKAKAEAGGFSAAASVNNNNNNNNNSPNNNNDNNLTAAAGKYGSQE